MRDLAPEMWSSTAGEDVGEVVVVTEKATTLIDR